MGKQKNVSLKFYPNKAKRNTKLNKVPIYLKLTFNGKKKEYRLDSALDVPYDELEKWDGEMMRFRGKNLTHINDYLNTLEARWSEFKRKHTYNLTGNLDEYTEIILGNNTARVQIRKLIEQIDYFLANNIEKRGDEYIGTKRNYRKAFKHFKNYLETHKLINLALEEFKYTHAQNFFSYLISPEIKNTDVSASANIKKVKAMFNDAIRQELITRNPFKDIKLTHWGEHKTPSLTPDQLRMILHCKQIENDTDLSYYRDLFIFGCYTGLSCINIIRLDNTMIFPIFDTRLKLETVRVKTGKLVLQIIPEPAQKIIEKYKEFGGKLKQRVFPNFTNETFNEKLKIIAAYSGINIRLSTKISRTTCNQIIDNAGEIPPLYKSAYLGWSNVSKIQDRYTTYTNNNLLVNTTRIETYLKKEKLY